LAPCSTYINSIGKSKSLIDIGIHSSGFEQFADQFSIELSGSKPIHLANPLKYCVIYLKFENFLGHMNQVQISLCIPQEYVRIVQVSLSSTVSELQRFWPNSPKHFIFKGAMLLETLTLALCGVENGDSIIALPQTTSSEFGVVQAWMSASRDVEGLNYSVRSLVNPATMQEAARLRDLRLTALESRPRAYRKFCRNFLQECPIETQSHKTVVSSERPSAPSTAALPAPWDQPRPFGPRKY
jgi:hypothetical protein